jgi:hypothetical protein
MPTYDLTDNAYFARKLQRSGAWIFGGIGASVVLLWIAYQPKILSQLVRALTMGLFLETAFDIVIEILVPISGAWLLYFVLVKNGLGPIQLDVDYDGLTLRFLSGRLLRAPYDDPGFSITIVDRRAIPTAFPQVRLELKVHRWNVPSAYISEAALNEILRSAHEQGLKAVYVPSPGVQSRSQAQRVIVVSHPLVRG